MQIIPLNLNSVYGLGFQGTPVPYFLGTNHFAICNILQVVRILQYGADYSLSCNCVCKSEIVILLKYCKSEQSGSADSADAAAAAAGVAWLGGCRMVGWLGGWLGLLVTCPPRQMALLHFTIWNNLILLRKDFGRKNLRRNIFIAKSNQQQTRISTQAFSKKVCFTNIEIDPSNI